MLKHITKCPTFNGRPTFAIREIVDQAWVKHSNDRLHLRNPTAQDMEILVKTCLMPLALKTQNDSFAFVHELKQEMHADLKYVESLEDEIDELESDKAEFSNMYDMLLQECVSKDVMCSYLQSSSDLDEITELQCLYLHKVRECDCLAQKLSEQTEFVSKEIYTELLRSFAKLEKHSISLEIALQQCQEQLKNDTVCKEKASNVFRKEREQYFEIQDLKAQLQDKNIAISELKKLIEKCKGKSVDTKFDKPSVVRQPNAQRIPKPSVLGKPAPFSDSLERTNFAKKKSVSKTNESEGLSKPVTPQNLPQTATQAVRNTNVIKPGMYRIASSTTQTRAPQLTQTSRNTNPRVSTSTGVAHRTNVSRPQPRSNQMKDKVLPNTSQVKFKKTEVEDHPRISCISKQTKSVTACNDSLNSRTLNVNAVCATCGKCVFNSNHDACVSKFLNDVNARTKKPNVVPISTRKPKSQANKSVATPHKKIVASESTTTNSKSYYRMLYKKTSKAWKWWIAQQCPSAYTWVPKTKRKWVPKVRNESVTKKIWRLLSENLRVSLEIFKGNDLLTAYTNTQTWIMASKDFLIFNSFTVNLLSKKDVNGVIERQNLTLVEAARTMLSASKLLVFFWAEAIATACYTQNKSIIIPTHEKTAYHIINDRKPLIKHLHIFCCTCYLTRDGENLDKMKEKGDMYILVGYSTQSKGYRVYKQEKQDLNSDLYISNLMRSKRCLRRLLLMTLQASSLKDKRPMHGRASSCLTNSKSGNSLTNPLARTRVYVAQPDGFVDPDHPEKVYLLRKALYGLKQAPRAWYDELSNFLISKGFTKGIQIHQSPRSIFINQAKYALEILKKHGMEKEQSIGTPMATKPKLDADLSGETLTKLYQARQTEKHLKEVKRIFRYLRGTINMRLWYPKGSGFELTTFSDADHAGCIDTRKSTYGGIQFLGDKLVSWMSKKQDCTAMSSVEAEYMTLSASSIAISCNPVQHSRTKHIHTRYHFIKEQVENGIIELYFVRTEYQLADMFTKALPEDRFQYLVRRIGMRCLTPAELEVLTNESA
ncbi:retrovirus-related pol polyprotein from transposon TNT 1-94 [Tanacetum coccineum]|uniref:Retrovirus-related pol polyprotein from transposon TNT 1-94 n=1 Tax=Tanacetum coccineum TaxID=301880 RepID=A0ABQ5CCF7_9ASTR